MDPPTTSKRIGNTAVRPMRASAVALLYLVIAGLWIWWSDALLARLLNDPAQMAAWQTYKGWIFVVVSAVMLWAERAWSDRRVADAEERLHARMEERTSELGRVRAQLQIILDNAPVAFSMRSVENQYILTNRRWEDFAGTSSEDALGKTPFEVFPPDVAQALTDALNNIWDKFDGVLEEVPMQLHGQDYVFMRASFPLFDEQGKPYAAIGLVTDITASKRVEESLRQAEERFRAIFNTVGVGINLVSPDGYYIGANPAFQRMLGYSEAELVGKSFRDITYPPDLVEDERVTSEIEQRPGEIGVLEKRYVRADGSLVWTRLLISAIVDSEGALVTYVTVVEDITARKEAEAQLQRAQAKLEQLVAERTAELQRAHDELAEAQRVAHVGNWNINLLTNELEWSAESYRIFGYEPNAFLGSRETFLASIHPDDRTLADRVRQEALAGKPMDYEHRVIRPNGEVRVVHERGYVVRDDTGRAVSIFGTVQDITERKQAEAEIRAINARLSAILQASPLGIIVLDTENLVQLWNPAAEQIYGYTEAEVLGREMPNLEVQGEPGDERDHHQEYVTTRQRVFSGERIDGMEAKRRRRDGTVVDVSISTAPLRGGDDTLAGVVALVRDITERKRAEAEVQRLNQELEARVIERTAHLQQEIAERVRAEAEVKELNVTLAEQAEHLSAVNKELETFTYSVSHDLKAPLRGIDGYSRLLLEDYAERLDEEGQYFLHTIRNATTQMGQLIDDLLSYSRLERRTLAVAPVDVHDLVDSVLFQMQPGQVYPQTKIDVAVEPAVVSADADALALVLRNLVDNALKFSANGPAPCVEIRGIKVEVAGHEEANPETNEAGGDARTPTYQIVVRDNGVGFDMQYEERIFDIFQRLHRSEEYPGTGIGLAMVRKALQRMHGRAWAVSQPGQGATFTMEIPIL